jgi:hypothetical protein
VEVVGSLSNDHCGEPSLLFNPISCLALEIELRRGRAGVRGQRTGVEAS